MLLKQNMDTQRVYNAGPTYGAQCNVQASDIAFDIHTQVETRFYDVKYPNREWYRIVSRDQLITDINAGATSYAYVMRSLQGSAAFIGHGPNNDIPKVGQSIGATQVPIAYSAVGAVITNEDSRQYQYGFNSNLARDLGVAMREACDNLVEVSVIFGNDALDFRPWINYPGITVYNAAASSGTPASTKWADKTGQEIVRDINSALTSIWESSRTIFTPTTIFLPLKQFALIAEMPMAIGSNNGAVVAQTVSEYLRRNNVMYAVTGRELEIIPSRYLSGAGTSDSDRMVIMDRSEDNQILPFPMLYTLSQPIPTPLSAEWYAEQKFGSYHVRQQGSMAYVDGI